MSNAALNGFCPAYLNDVDQQIDGPHNFEYGESSRIFCTACGEVRDLGNVGQAASFPTSAPTTTVGAIVPAAGGNGII